MTEALIIDACRTPRGIGKAGKGALSDIHPQQLGADCAEARSPSAPASTPPTSTTSSGAPAPRSVRSPATWAACRRSTPATTSARRGVTLDRFCGSGITTVNMAAASIMSGQEDLVIAGGTEKMSMQVRARRRADDDGLRQSAPARAASAVAPGCLRRCGRDARRHFARGHRQAGADEPAARRRRHQERPFQQEPGAGLSRGRQPRARQGGVPAAADDAGSARGAEARVPGGGRLRRSTTRARPIAS